MLYYLVYIGAALKPNRHPVLSGMTIFARRTLQSFLTALDGTLTSHQLGALVNRLNRENLNSLAAEWEICILIALMNFGHITYEPALIGKTRPDFQFTAADNAALEFVADVTLISDSDLERNNPILELTQILYRKARKLGITGTFSYRVGSGSTGRQGAHKVQLSIPHIKKLQAFFEHFLVPHLRALANPHLPMTINVAEGAWHVNISYDPKGRFSHGSYRAFRNATVKDSNPLYNALNGKRKQLRDSEYLGCKGIIVCDGGCEVIQNGIASWDTYSRKQILTEFFRSTGSISFVIFIWIEAKSRPGVKCQPRVCGEIETNPDARVPPPEELVYLLRRLPQFWPQPVQTGEHARLQVEGYGQRNIPRNWGRPVGGYRMGSGPNRITYRMSARELLEILSGRRTIQEFERDAGFAPHGDGGPINPFENALRRGFTISAATLEAISDRDDDWVEFRITGPDPALSSFRKPGQSTG